MLPDADPLPHLICSRLISGSRGGDEAVTTATRDELVVAVRERYPKSERSEKARILDEFVAVTGFHGKHAMGGW